MFLLAEGRQALLRVAPSGDGLALAVPRALTIRAMPDLLRLHRDGAAGRLRTPGGGLVVAGPDGLSLQPRPPRPGAARWQVTEAPDGALLLSRDGRFLQAGAEGRVAPTATDPAMALRFRPLSARAAFRLLDRQVTRRWGTPHATGRFLRFARRAEAGEAPMVLRDARLIGQDWTALMPGGVRHWQPTVHAHRRAQRGLVAYPRPEPGRFDEACLLGGYYNYYHHFADYLLNWFDVRERIGADVPLLTQPPEQRFQREILDAFGIAHRAVPVPPLGMVRVRRLVVPRSAVIGAGEVRDRSTIEACRAFLDARIAPQADAPRRIFISRAEAPTRRAPNEEQAIAIARRHGFVPVRLETLSFLDQVALFRRAEAVAGLHGAGFANLLFAPPGCRVIEIMPTDPLQPRFFANLSAGLDLPFERVAARGAFHGTDLEIDLAGFAAALAVLRD